MKKSFLLIVAAVSFCGSPCQVMAQQGQLWLGGTPTLAPRLVAAQADADASDDLLDSMSFEPQAVENPFGFDNRGSAEVEAAVPDSGQFSEGSLDQAPAEDPASIPVGRHHRQRTIVDTMADYSMIQGVSDATLYPVDWNQGMRTPNPIADMMLRQHCADGIWSGYEAQKARECARQYAHLAGHGHGCSCGNVGAVGCGCHAAPACGSCGGGQVVNRYRSGTAGCTHCASAQLNGSVPAMVAGRPEAQESQSKPAEATPAKVAGYAFPTGGTN